MKNFEVFTKLEEVSVYSGKKLIAKEFLNILIFFDKKNGIKAHIYENGNAHIRYIDKEDYEYDLKYNGYFKEELYTLLFNEKKMNYLLNIKEIVTLEFFTENNIEELKNKFNEFIEYLIELKK